MSNSLQPREVQLIRPPCPRPTCGAYPNSYPLSWWCHPAISSSVVLFSSCLQSFPASGSFQMSQLFTSSGQSTGVSASTSVLGKYNKCFYYYRNPLANKSQEDFACSRPPWLDNFLLLYSKYTMKVKAWKHERYKQLELLLKSNTLPGF